ncbi:hypothetical protein RJZ56_000891 [Blastomyces dermatitidis]|uniref:Uncharacterized protein n=1 Tax=Ajellomyces dermatitidis (strain ATCC 18188 / CBS 674.68) TaxID=653446 RepID=F2TD78_AJEDA|nr:hypothetical protein BDDG_04130 [Blastomyces dermatitidis ATCC 18188]EQL34923.1 hypothetical protein BDFG_03356 [Blastomyces dermatitidis ATCC 26199]
MATLQASISRSNFNLASSYKPALVTVIQPSRPAQRRFTNRFSASSFTTASPAHKEAQQNSKNEGPSDLDPRSTESTNSGTHAEVASQQTAFIPSDTAPESELEEVRQQSAEDNGAGANASSKENKRAKNPLEVSPANRDVSISKDECGKEPSSRRASPTKGKEV